MAKGVKSVWCVRHRDGWCACRQNRRYREETVNVPTLCDHFVVLHNGIEKRVPTCPECLKLLHESGGRESGTGAGGGSET